MAILPYSNPISIFPSSRSHFNVEGFCKTVTSGRRDFVAFSSHSNPRILKPNRRSPYGQQLSPYEDEDGDEDGEEEESPSSDDESAELEEFSGDLRRNRKPLNVLSEKETAKAQDTWRLPKKALLKDTSSKARQGLSTYHFLAAKHQSSSINSVDTNRSDDMGSEQMDGKRKVRNGCFTESRFRQLEDLDFDEKWFPLIEYLSTFGLKESHIIQIYERHMPCLQINMAAAQERLEFLLSVGVKHRDIRKILMRQPQILEYTVENNQKSHVAFLTSLGIPNSRIGQIISATPSLFSYSVEHSLKPTIRYLVEEVGIKESDVSKVVQLSPQILVQRIDNSWTTRFFFLSKELEAPRDSIVKMVTKHPQLLHYSIEDGILPRINFLRSIGMRNSDILKVLTSITQVLSLSLEDNLKPKYLYLVNELGNAVQSLTKYPTYLSLSLDQRIRPRHRFLVSLKKAPKGPFPLSFFVPTDECFCQQRAGTSVERYQAFRQSLLLSDFARKYGRKG